MAIKTVVLLSALLLSSCCYALPYNESTKTQIQATFDNMKAAAGYPELTLKFLCASEKDKRVINAYYNRYFKTVQLTCAFIYSADSIDAVATAIGHEIGHHHLYELNLESRSPANELEADRYGYTLAMSMGYDISVDISRWEEHKKQHGDCQQGIHPCYSTRINLIEDLLRGNDR